MADQRLHTDRANNPYLSPNQQDLLLAALQSQAKATPTTRNTNTEVESEAVASSSLDPATNMTTLGAFTSADGLDADTFGDEFTPDLDYLDGDNSYDFENADLGGDLIGALPGSGSDANVDSHEKRKSPDENDNAEEGDAKRQETQDGEKGAKKPGRKPLTSEPTTKRKAQNRAAQRAFRERKEKHLKDLETQVSELTKASEADKHENGLLKAQVERLQIELREYRKRLALNNAGTGRSPPLNATNNRSSSGPASNNAFTFDFPKFGALPGSQIFGNSAATQSASNLSSHRHSATPSLTQSPSSIGGYAQSSPNDQTPNTRSLSPKSLQRNDSNTTDSPAQANQSNQQFSSYSTDKNMHGFASTLSTGVVDPLGDLFSPSILKSASIDSYFGTPDPQLPTTSLYSTNDNNGGDSTAGLNRVFQFNSGSSISDSTSPSASTPSQWNGNVAANSSCGTSPEPAHDSPANNENSRRSFDTGNHFTQYADTTKQKNTDTTNSAFSFGASDYSMPAMNSFDPVLFGEYRDSHNAIVGDGEFNNGFFDDALNSNTPFDYGSPSNLFGILQTPQPTHNTSINTSSSNNQPPSKSLMAEIDKTRDGADDEIGNGACGGKNYASSVTSDEKLISCNNIWSQLQSNPDFQEGKFDLDSLCSELRQKARCSESGVMVEQSHVDAALRKLGKKDDKGVPIKAPPLMFEQKSWDNVLAKLGAQ